MVRTLVGTLVEVGRGHRPVEWTKEVLASRDRAKAGPTAPPTGLFLVSVDYE
jgi:tRNA pseudouridine38-40 synthase